ncbi:hypothetical protein JNUCC1_00504 [Lentibacillus sp. JNUCC-1]|nr:hypothetical protein [Lentibacillus sp. JNUCC-1]
MSQQKYPFYRNILFWLFVLFLIIMVIGFVVRAVTTW